MRPTALLVDDDSTTIAALPNALQCRLPRLRIETTTNAVDAVSRLDRVSYSVVLADYRMPRMDGMSLLREVKRRSPETSVILMTGTNDAALEAQAFEAGAFDFLPKPLDRDDLTTTIQLALCAYSLQRDLKAWQERSRRYSERLRHLRTEPGLPTYDFKERLAQLVEEASVVNDRVHATVMQCRALIKRNEAHIQEIRNRLQSVHRIAQQRSRERFVRRLLLD